MKITPRYLFVSCLCGLVLVLLGACNGSSSNLANDLVACTQNTDCPADYHCAVDLRCWRNGQDPTTDGSVPISDGSIEAGGCPQGFVTCGGACVDPTSNPKYCGAKSGCSADAGTAGTACPGGEVCAASTCRTSCPAGTVNCGGSCFDPQSNLEHCGATMGCGTDGGSSGTACASGEVCSAGKCALSCQAGLVNCGGTCFDPISSVQYCGATAGCGTNDGGSSGVACASGQVCSEGSCSLTCQAGLVNCGGTCVDPQTSRVFCGASIGCGDDGGSIGTACASGQVCNAGVCSLSCQAGLVNCNGVCVDPLTSRSFCGASDGCGTDGGSAGTACSSGQVCNAGSCSISCQAGLVNCNGVCVDPNTSRTYCGATLGCGADAGTSGSSCDPGQVCNGGSCSVSCQTGLVNCGGTCVDPTTSRTYCGATNGCGADGGSPGSTCTSGQVCNAGSCSVSCQAGLINCNGTCIDPNTNPTYCGASNACDPDAGTSGQACLSGQVCNSGSCALTCQSGLVNCNGTCIDPLSSLLYCGATNGCSADAGTSGTACVAGQVCSNGTCALTCQSGLVNCGGTCIDPLYNRAYCGASNGCAADAGTAGSTCASGQVCSKGSCSLSCQAGLLNCNGTCIDPQSDLTYCGATTGCGNDGGIAGQTCANGFVCSLGTCKLSCQAGLVNCNGTCVDPNTNRTYCGATSGCGTPIDGGVGDAGVGSAGTTCASGQVCNAGSCALSCQAGLTNCGGTCVDTTTSNAVCGADSTCLGGSVCPDGTICSGGKCALDCQAGLVNCNGTCIDPTSSNTYCNATVGCGLDGGTQGSACAPGTVCSHGVCSLTCQTGLVNCGGTCIDPLTSRAYCGASIDCGNSPDAGVDGGTPGTPCANGQICSNGQCALSCQGGLIDCGGTCVDPKSSRSNCGASLDCSPDAGTNGATCSSGSVCSNGSCQISCPSGQIDCNGICVNPAASQSHCGATGACGVVDAGPDAGSAGVACGNGTVCVSGQCQVSCPGTEINCGGNCIQPSTDPNYCGASGACGSDGGSIGNICEAGTTCVSSACGANCASPLIACSGECVDPRYDPGHCNGCNPCNFQNATGYCANTVCTIASCAGSYSDCNHDASDGCETDVSSDRANCGACGNACSSTQACLSGVCGAPPIQCGYVDEGDNLTLQCPDGSQITAVDFASFGLPYGSCGSYSSNSGCNNVDSTYIVEQECVGYTSCTLQATNGFFDYDPCEGTHKYLAVQVECGYPATNPVTNGIIAEYDARVASSISQDGSNDVYQWNDISGNGNNLFYNGSTPYYYSSGLINGQAGIDFSYTGMVSSGFQLNASSTIFFVITWTGNAYNWGSIAHHGDRDNDWSMEQNGSAEGDVHWQTNNDNSTTDLQLYSGENYILVGRIDPTNGRYFQATSNDYGTQTTTGSASYSLTTGVKTMYVGESNIGELSNIYYGHIIYYGRSLSDTEVAEVVSYLQQSWGF